MTGSLFASLVTPVNLSTDLVDSVALRMSAALRIADHHLNAAASSVFLPGECKDIELFCVSQACIVYSMKHLKERLQNARFHSIVGAVIPVVSDMWVQSLGRASITFGHVITFEGEMLATMTRIYVRKNVKTGVLLEVTETERTELFPARPTGDFELPVVTKLEVPSENDMTPLFTVRIGPQHCNNDHVDHAALADLILQGMYIRGFSYSYEMPKLSLQYVAPAELNEELSVCVHKERPLVALYKQGSGLPLVVGQVESPRRNKL